MNLDVDDLLALVVLLEDGVALVGAEDDRGQPEERPQELDRPVLGAERLRVRSVGSVSKIICYDTLFIQTSKVLFHCSRDLSRLAIASL